MNLFPGTLNIQLNEPYTLPKQIIRLEAAEYGGNVSVNIVPCSMLGRMPLFFAPTETRTVEGTIPETILEIATDVKLRHHFHLKDGDIVEIETFDG